MKYTLRHIKQTTDVTTIAIAEQAGLSPTDVFVVEAGGYISQEKAQKVVTAFNQLSGMRITLEDITVRQGNRP